MSTTTRPSIPSQVRVRTANSSQNLWGGVQLFTIGGQEYSVKFGDENSIDLVADRWYKFFLDKGNNTINFIGGGGLSNGKLAEATATASDVYTGKKFYSGDKTLKTGTLSLAATAVASDVLAGKTFFAGNATKKTGTLVNGSPATKQYAQATYGNGSSVSTTLTPTDKDTTYVIISPRNWMVSQSSSRGSLSLSGAYTTIMSKQTLNREQAHEQYNGLYLDVMVIRVLKGNSVTVKSTAPGNYNYGSTALMVLKIG